jgi:hypothetical protein
VGYRHFHCNYYFNRLMAFHEILCNMKLAQGTTRSYFNYLSSIKLFDASESFRGVTDSRDTLQVPEMMRSYRS